MSKKESYYSLYMGKNEFPLSYHLYEKENWKEMERNRGEDINFIVNTAIPRVVVKEYDIDMENGEDNIENILSMQETDKFRVYNINNLPKTQNDDRKFQEFEDVILKQPKSKITLKVKLKERIADDYALYRKGKKLLICF